MLYAIYVQSGFEGGKHLNRKEAIALLIELGANQLVTPNFVILEQLQPDSFQLKIKGDYNLKDIGIFLKNRFSIGESKNYLTISTL